MSGRWMRHSLSLSATATRSTRYRRAWRTSRLIATSSIRRSNSRNSKRSLESMTRQEPYAPRSVAWFAGSKNGYSVRSG